MLLVAQPINSRPLASGSARNQVSGEVLWTDATRQEPPDWSFVQAMTAPLSCLGCLTIPFLLLSAALANGSVLLVLLIGGGLYLATRLFRSQNLMNFLYFKTLFFPSTGGKGNRLVPVQSFRMRTNSGEERAVRMKGETDVAQAGHIGIGDQVTFWGDWKGGTLHAYRAYNHNTLAWVAIKRPRPWVLLVILLVIAVLIGSLVSDAGRTGSRHPPSAPAPNAGQN